MAVVTGDAAQCHVQGRTREQSRGTDPCFGEDAKELHPHSARRPRGRGIEHPSLSAQVLRLCNSALFGLRHRVISIEQAAVLLGTERLRTLVLTCSLMQFAGKHVPMNSLLRFWQHSFLAALLSERIARQVDYPEREQAYLGGLMHDIGQLPANLAWTRGQSPTACSLRPQQRSSQA